MEPPSFAKDQQNVPSPAHDQPQLSEPNLLSGALESSTGTTNSVEQRQMATSYEKSSSMSTPAEPESEESSMSGPVDPAPEELFIFGPAGPTSEESSMFGPAEPTSKVFFMFGPDDSDSDSDSASEESSMSGPADPTYIAWAPEDSDSDSDSDSASEESSMSEPADPASEEPSMSTSADPEFEERTFTCFPNLPTKLRVKVWTYFSKQETRHVEVIVTIPKWEPDKKPSRSSSVSSSTVSSSSSASVSSESSSAISSVGSSSSVQTASSITPSSTQIPKKLPKFKTSTPIPSVLHVCHESRIEGLKIYETVFKVKDEEGVQRREIYINPAVDTLLVHIPYWTEDWYDQTCVYNWQLGESDETGPWQSSQHKIFKVHAKVGHYALPADEDGRRDWAGRMLIIAGTPEALSGTKDPSVGKVLPALERYGIKALYRPVIEPLKVQYWNPMWECLFEEVMKERQLKYKCFWAYVLRGRRSVNKGVWERYMQRSKSQKVYKKVHKKVHKSG